MKISRQNKWIIAGLAGLVIIVLAILNRAWLAEWSDQNGVVLRQAIVTGILIGGVFGLVAMGLTLIFGVLDIINFAHGALLTIGMYIAFVLFDRFGIDPYLAILITVPALFLIGIIIQRTIIHPARNAPAHNQLLLTLGLALFIENLMLVMFTATPRSIRLEYGRGLTEIGPLAIDFPIRIAGTTITLTKLAAFIFAVVLTALLYLLLHRTTLGKAIRATAQNKEGARLVGISTDRISLVTFGLGVACVGAAAALVLPFLAVDPLVGNTFNITAFVIVVLGGMGSIPGALLGGLIIGLTQELGVVFAPSSTKLLGVFFVFILVLLIRPQGLLGEKGMKRLRRIPVNYIIAVLFLVVLSLLPLFLDRFLLSLALLVLFWAYLGNAWNIMGGYTGLFSFGHAMFYGIGAYTSTVLLVDYGISPWVGMLAGALIAGLFGAFVGYLLSRFGVKGHFFALGTFAIAEMVRLLATEMEFINTSIGIHIPLVRGDSWIRMQFEETYANYYYVILILFVIGQIITITIVRNKLGYYFQAIREDEEAAAALGVNVLRYKVISVAISAALTAIGGTFFAQYFLFIDPTIVFGVSVSVQILLRPIVGGVGTIWGPFVGALLLTPLAEFTRTIVRTPPSFLDFIQGRSGVDVMLFGAILIIVVLFMPDGIIGAGKRLLMRVRKRNDVVT